MTEREEVFSRVLRAGKRTYFFDVKATKANDYYLTISESKKITNDDGSFRYKKHKIYLYKEDFSGFKDALDETMGYIIDERGNEVISEHHRKRVDDNYNIEPLETESEAQNTSGKLTDIDFDDI